MQFQKNLLERSPCCEGEDNEDTNDDDGYNYKNQQIIPEDFLLEGWSLKTLPRAPFKPKGSRPFMQAPIQSKRPFSLRKYELFKNSPRNNFSDTAMISTSSFGIPYGDTTVLDRLNTSIQGLQDTSKGQISYNFKTQGHFKESNDIVGRTQTDCYHGAHTNRKSYRKNDNCVFSAKPIKSEKAAKQNHQEEFQEFIGNTHLKIGFKKQQQQCFKVPTNNFKNKKGDQENVAQNYRFLSLDEQIQLAERNKTEQVRNHNSRRSSKDNNSQDNNTSKMRETFRLKLSVKNREMGQTQKLITHRASSSKKQSAEKENTKDQSCEKDRLEKQIKLISQKQTQWNQVVAFHLKHSMIPSNITHNENDTTKDRYGNKNNVSLNSFVTQQKQLKQLEDKCLTNVTQDGRCFSPLETAPTISSRHMNNTRRKISTTNGNERENITEDCLQTSLKFKQVNQSKRRRKDSKNNNNREGQELQHLDENSSRLQSSLNILNLENTAQMDSLTHKRILSDNFKIQGIHYKKVNTENEEDFNEISVVRSKIKAQIRELPRSGLMYSKLQTATEDEQTKLPWIIPSAQSEQKTEKEQQQQEGHQLLQFYQPRIALMKSSGQRVLQRVCQESCIQQGKIGNERKICSQSLPQTFRNNEGEQFRIQEQISAETARKFQFQSDNNQGFIEQSPINTRKYKKQNGFN